MAAQTTVFAASNLQVNVPFSFVVARKEMKPGSYTVKEDNLGVILVQGHGGSAFAVTIPSEAAGTAPALRFTSNDQVNILPEWIWTEVKAAPSQFRLDSIDYPSRARRAS